MQQGLASLEKAPGHGIGLLSRFNGSRYVCCVEEQEIMFRELCFGVSDIKSGRILGANKIWVRASVRGGVGWGLDGVGCGFPGGNLTEWGGPGCMLLGVTGA